MEQYAFYEELRFNFESTFHKLKSGFISNTDWDNF